MDPDRAKLQLAAVVGAVLGIMCSDTDGSSQLSEHSSGQWL